MKSHSAFPSQRSDLAAAREQKGKGKEEEEKKNYLLLTSYLPELKLTQ